MLLSGNNIKFGNPVNEFKKKLSEGHYNSDNVKMSELLKKIDRRHSRYKSIRNMTSSAYFPPSDVKKGQDLILPSFFITGKMKGNANVDSFKKLSIRVRRYYFPHQMIQSNKTLAKTAQNILDQSLITKLLRDTSRS